MKIYNIAHTGAQLKVIYDDDQAQVLVGIDLWKDTEFGPNANIPAIAGNNADPDGDGIVNLLEYALGLDPNSANATTGITSDSTTAEFSIIYQRNKEATDLNFIIEGQDNLTPNDWPAATVTETILSTDGNIETVKATIQLGDNTRYFLRLRVTHE